MCYEHHVRIKTQIINEEIKTENNQNSLLSSIESKREIEKQNKKVKYHLDKMNFLMSVDISLSKPIFVRKTSNKAFNFMPQGTTENENTNLTFSRRN